VDLIYLCRADVEGLGMTMRDVLDAVDEGFRAKGRGLTEMPPKPGVHPRPDCFIHAMPARVKPAVAPGYAEAAGPAAGVPAGEPAPRIGTVAPRIGRVTSRTGELAGVKWVSGYPPNKQRGIPYISGVVVLNDCETGYPVAVMDCSWITAMRTGAATGLSAKYLARTESKVAGILACGVQGRTNLEALACLFPLERVYAYDILPEAQEKYVAEMRGKFKFEIIGVKEPKQAVVESDLVVTSGPILKHPTPTIQKDWLKPGSFGSAVDFDSYWGGAALAQMDRISTDDHAQFQYYKSVGYFQQTPDPSADLGELAAGLMPGRQSNKERTLAINLGLAMDDMAIAPEIYRRAREKGIGVWLPL